MIICAQEDDTDIQVVVDGVYKRKQKNHKQISKSINKNVVETTEKILKYDRVDVVMITFSI